MEAVVVRSGYVPEPIEVPGAPQWLSALRRNAFLAFEKTGFPTPHDEAWRYTGLQPITGTAWVNARAPLPTFALPPGVRLRRVAEVREREVEGHLAKIATLEGRPFSALNAAALEDAYVLEIDPGAVLAEPITLNWTAPAPGEVTHPRVLVLAGERSQATVVETYTFVNDGEGRYLRNAVTEIALAEGAMMEHYAVQRESISACHVHTIAVRQGRASHFTSHNVALGSALARVDLDVRLDAEGAECTLNGLFAGAGTQHLDNRTTIDHAKPHCVSRELYKGVMDGASRGVFFGKIIVRPDAQKTDAIQTNKNLLLSREALVNSTPALEIFADDVKCKHGSTTGQLDLLALFYLRSRGIGEAEARTLLTQAFAADVAERLRVPAVREAVTRELARRLGGGA